MAHTIEKATSSKEPKKSPKHLTTHIHGHELIFFLSRFLKRVIIEGKSSFNKSQHPPPYTCDYLNTSLPSLRQQALLYNLSQKRFENLIELSR